MLEGEPKFTAKFFQIENDALDPQQVEQMAEPSVYAQFEYTLLKVTYDDFQNETKV